MAKKKEAEVYTRRDFLDMTLSEIFGFWCLIKLDHIEYAGPKDYSEIYVEFENNQVSKVCEYLAAQGINKPGKAVSTNQDGHDV